MSPPASMHPAALVALIVALAIGQQSNAALAATRGPASVAVDLAPFLKNAQLTDVKLSPNGDYYALTVPMVDRTALVVIRRADRKLMTQFSQGRDTHIGQFDWVSPTRLLLSLSEQFGALDQPQSTGELYAVDADGKAGELLVGFRAQGEGLSTLIKKKEPEYVAAFLIDDLPDDDKNVLISVMPWVSDPFTRVEKMNVDTGRRSPVTRVPVGRAVFLSDHKGVIRFARGSGVDNVSKLYHRAGDAAEWVLVNDEATTDRVESVLGFAEGDKIAYLQVEHPEGGPDSIVSYDTASGERKPLLRDASVDPAFVIGKLGSPRTPVGAGYLGAKPGNAFFDEKSTEARLYRSLEASFPGQLVTIGSSTSDGKLALVEASSAGNPGEFFLFDVASLKAERLLGRRDWLDPEAMATVRPIALAARDGVPLQGFLTLPIGSSGKGLPMVVMPHGGPFGLFDAAAFDPDAQMLAKAGYAVLQLNFRGSGNYGRKFQQAGARQWGGAMQDDLTDATRWAVKEGVADGGRVCIYGASYGGYAAMMGAAREPDLYRCAAGYVGVYDLTLMDREIGREGSGSSRTWMNEWVGERQQLEAISANRLAGRIKVPVFLAAGAEDKVAPIEHSRRMATALRAAGVPVETMYADGEGHGFYTEANRRDYYTRLLAFLGTHLGGGSAK